MLIWFCQKQRTDILTGHDYNVSDGDNPTPVAQPQDEEVEKNDNNQAMERSRMSFFLDQTEKKYPRVFNVVTVIIIPLIVLILIATFCGHFLALLESEQEIDSIHSSIASFVDETDNVEDAVDIIEKTYENCLDTFIKEHIDKHFQVEDLREYINMCTSDGREKARSLVQKQKNMARKDLIGDVELHWNRCFLVEEDGTKNKLNEQHSNLVNNWLEVFNSSLDNNSTHEGAINNAKEHISHNCKVNSAGGAMFWFTIMTTIGYGNTAPVTVGGRALVYIAGFLSILLFESLIRGASYVFLTLADDFFITFNMKMLTNGWPSVLFWLSILWLYIIFLTGINVAYNVYKYESVMMSYEDMVWFCFISVTTVGFGDFYISHDMLFLSDVFYVPLLTLMGFVFFANFLLKLATVISAKVRQSGITDEESFHYLLSQNRRGVNLLNLVAKDRRKFRVSETCSINSFPKVPLPETTNEPDLTGKKKKHEGRLGVNFPKVRRWVPLSEISLFNDSPHEAPFHDKKNAEDTVEKEDDEGDGTIIFTSRYERKEIDVR